MGDKSDWYYDSDSTSSGLASQIRSNDSEWQNAVDANGNLFYVKKFTPRQFTFSDTSSSSRLDGSDLSKTPSFGSGIFDKLVRRKSSQRDGAKGTEWSLRSSQDQVKKASTANSSFAGMLYTTFTQLEDSTESVIYGYPLSKNILSSARGLFITLLHLFPAATSSKPSWTTFRYMDSKINAGFVYDGDHVLLLALPDDGYSRTECYRILLELSSYQKFVFQTLPRCYATPIDNFSDLDAFFENFFQQLDCQRFASLQDKLHFSFPTAVSYVVVPKDIYMLVVEAINEFQSNDIDCASERRKYSIIGCAYFFKDYAVCSHFLRDDLLEVYTLMRETGILQCGVEGVNDLVFWREVFPLSLNRGLISMPSAPYAIPFGRWFLLVVSLGHNTLATLLESGGCTSKIVGPQGPDPLYVKEAQATLRHIIKLGTSHFLSNCTGEKEITNEGTLTLGRPSQSLTSFGKSNLLGSVKSFDMADINACLDDNLPVLGRRAERQLNEITFYSAQNLTEITKDSTSRSSKNYSDHLSESSDIGGRISGDRLTIANHRSCSGRYDQYFHYLHFDSSEGIIVSNLFSEPNCSSFSQIVDNFKSCAQQIQDVFRNTISFRDNPSGIANVPYNKSTVALKEYGILFQMPNDEDKSDGILYWVTGRLMTSPRRELYACYEDGCPVNLVELAFQLALSSSR